MIDSLPTTKKDASNHGYGLESIKRIAEKYGGSISIACEDGIFELVAMIPS